MDRCNIGRRWLNPNIGTSGIIACISHLSCTVTFLFYFSNSIIFFTQSNNIYHILYYTVFEIHSHQPFNQFFLLFGCLDNTFITQTIWSFRIINTFIIVLKFRMFLFVFVIIITIFCFFHFCNRIISTSMWRIILFRLWSICSFRVIIIFLV